MNGFMSLFRSRFEHKKNRVPYTEDFSLKSHQEDRIPAVTGERSQDPNNSKRVSSLRNNMVTSRLCVQPQLDIAARLTVKKIVNECFAPSLCSDPDLPNPLYT
jgi:hypothetical protein